MSSPVQVRTAAAVELSPTKSSPAKSRSSGESTRSTSSDLDPYSATELYYGTDGRAANHHRARTYSNHEQPVVDRSNLKPPVRRSSHDETTLLPTRFAIHVKKTIKQLEAQEDTDENCQITVEDGGPKVISLGTFNSGGYKKKEVRGNYVLSNLLQELYIANEKGHTTIRLDEARLNENPVNRLYRRIKDDFWNELTRVIDGTVIEKAGRDPKDWTDDPRPRIYVPAGCPEQYAYYCQVAKDRPEIRLDVCLLPALITPELVQSLNAKPGLLAVDMETVIDPVTKEKTLKGRPFVVPGGRFNEFYGWDSYMESLGLILNDKVDLAKSMVLNFCFCIKHYGKILNATRSYYLCRSQPPFLTDMALRVYDKISHQPEALEFLRVAILSAIKEYHTVWCAAPRLDKRTGLSRYRPEGLGVPPETEPTHFTHIIEPYAEKNGMSFDAFVEAYNTRKVNEPELDDYFMHDRAVRESGHDTSYRLEKVCADLATIDLNSLLYKYERDITYAIKNHFKDIFPIPNEYLVAGMKPGHVESSAVWERRCRNRKDAIDRYLWNEKKGMYFDYNTVEKKQCDYESATMFWALWCGVASPKQAALVVEKGMPLFEQAGGLVSGTERSRGVVGLDRPNRQWDYPYGWAPQQMLAWSGLKRYGFTDDAERLAYRWLLMMTRAFVDYHGVVVEKYDVTRLRDPHRVDAEYGNQGLDFKGVASEGFGWVNASYVYGMKFLTAHQRRALGTLTPWETYARAMAPTIYENEADRLAVI